MKYIAVKGKMDEEMMFLFPHAVSHVTVDKLYLLEKIVVAGFVTLNESVVVSRAALAATTKI